MKCEYCGQGIRSAAHYCNHCGQDTSLSRAIRSDRNMLVVFGVVGVCAIFALTLLAAV